MQLPCQRFVAIPEIPLQLHPMQRHRSAVWHVPTTVRVRVTPAGFRQMIRRAHAFEATGYSYADVSRGPSSKHGAGCTEWVGPTVANDCTACYLLACYHTERVGPAAPTDRTDRVGPISATDSYERVGPTAPTDRSECVGRKEPRTVVVPH